MIGKRIKGQKALAVRKIFIPLQTQNGDDICSNKYFAVVA